MTPSCAERKPAFLWQAMLILLPVVGLAVLGLFSLRQDRRLAEQDAQQQAQTFAELLARECRLRLDADLPNFAQQAEARRLNATRMAIGEPEQATATNAPGDASDAKGLLDPLSDLLQPYCLLRDTNLFDPPDLISVPEPPDWLLSAPSDWLVKWDNAQALLHQRHDREVVRELLESIRRCNVRPLQANAELALTLLTEPSEEKFTTLCSMAGRFRDHTTGSGVSLGDLALLHAIDAAPPGVSFDRLLHEASSSAAFAPSFLTGQLLTALEQRAEREEETVRERVHAIRALWEMDRRTRAMLKAWLSESGPRSGVYRVATENGEVFLFSHAYGYAFTNVTVANGEPAATNVVTGGQFTVLPVPESVIDTALRRVAENFAPRWPAYFGATFDIAGRSFALRPGVRRIETTGRVLATQADGISGALAGYYPFTVNVRLTHPALLFTQQRQRLWLFGGLIVAAAAVALAGAWLLQRNLARQFRLNEQKSNFVSSVSHELRAPIASVRLMAESLDRGKVQEPEKQREYFAFIVQECRRLSSLIENVLDFSRIEQGRKQFDFEPTDLDALVRQTVKLMEPYAVERGVGLRLETSNIQHPTSNIELEADGKALQQALVNLIDNAIKHSPKGEVVTVSIETPLTRPADTLSPSDGERDGVRGSAQTLNSQLSTLNLSVTDHGPGIPPEEHEKIFERFYRRGSELRRETQGVGIGLSIVKHIVEAHGGRVVVHSTIGKGSRFTIELPLNR